MEFKGIQNNFINFEGIFEKAKKENEQGRIREEDFASLYGEKQIQEDKELVTRLKEENEKNNTPREKEAKKLATVFEVILSGQAELSEWLGSQVVTMDATEYDDRVNGVDMIAEIDTGKGSASYMGLAIDATYSKNLTEKFTKIKGNIDKGRLATIKYFSSPNRDFMGQLSQVPRVVVGASIETINELIELWANDRKKELSEHPVQFQIIDLIITQLETYKHYAKKIGNKELVIKFDHFIDIFVEIYESRKETIGDSGKRDSMFQTIIDELDSVID